jgi:hypothetical protein
MMSSFVAHSWNMTPLDIELKAWKQCLVGKQPNRGEGPRCTWCHGLLFHIHLWLLLWIGVGRNVLQRCHEIENIKCSLWIDTTFPLWQWGKLHMNVWSWWKGKLPQGYVQFNMECDLMWYENKVEITVGIHLQNLMGENNFGGVQIPSHKDYL